MWPWDAPGSAGLRDSTGVLQTRTKKPVGPPGVLGFSLIPLCCARGEGFGSRNRMCAVTDVALGCGAGCSFGAVWGRLLGGCCWAGPRGWSMGHGCVRLRAALCCCSRMARRRQAVVLLAGCGVGMGGAVCRCGVPGSC